VYHWPNASCDRLGRLGRWLYWAGLGAGPQSPWTKSRALGKQQRAGWMVGRFPTELTITPGNLLDLRNCAKGLYGLFFFVVVFNPYTSTR
jgi:hypothetical protein